MTGALAVSDDELAEIVSDFPTFCGLLEIRLKEAPPKPFAYESWFGEQQAFEYERTGRDIVLKPRQVGFTTLELARDLWYALLNRGRQVLVIAHDGDLAETLFQTLHIFCDSLSALGILPERKYSSKREVVFAAPLNSAIRIVEAGATEISASKKGRSGTIHRLHATEVAFWGAALETMAAVLSAVPKNGEVVIESTANGAGGWFFDRVMAAQTGRGRYKLHFYPWYGHTEYRLPANDNGFDPSPRDDWEKKLRAHGCDDEQIAFWRNEVEDKGLDKALQEYPESIASCFRSAGRLWFAPSVLDAITSAVRQPKRLAPIVFRGRRFEAAHIFEEPIPGDDYVIFGDAAEGIARDGSAATVLHRKSGRTVATWWSDSTPPSDFGLVMAVLGWLFNTALVSPERNDPGPATLATLDREANYPRIYTHEDGRYGFPTTSKTRPQMWDALAFAIREGSASTPDADTLQECRTLIIDEDGKPRARGKKKKSADSSRDDRYVSWAGAWQLRSRTAGQVRRSFSIPGV